MKDELDSNTPDHLYRWRLVLGGDEADGTECGLDGVDLRLDQALSALYDQQRHGGLESSAPRVARWLGDIREFFPASVVRVMQQDAIERLNLRQMLLEPELLLAVEPDVHLVATLLSLNTVLPERARETARQVVRQVLDNLARKLSQPLRQAVLGSLSRAQRNRRPRHHELDWPRTIKANLKHYQPAYRTIIPETLHGYGRQRSALRDVILCVDQSGSMLASVVYAGLFGAVLASLPALRTRVVAFDTAVVDLTEDLHDPVQLLFGTQLGGGTDINRALAYCQGLIERPHDTILLLLSDLFEGGSRDEMFQRAAALTQAGVQVIALLALSDDGAPAFNHEVAGKLSRLGIAAFACTPDLFPDLMAAAIGRQDVAAWAAGSGIIVHH